MSAVPPTLAAPNSTVDDFAVLAERADVALNSVEKLDPGPRREALALKGAIEEFHKHGLVKIVRHLKQDPRGLELLRELAVDPAVYALFSMHGILRDGVTARVSRAVEDSRAYMQSHGGDVEFVRVEDGIAFIKLHGSCNGCSMSSVTLRNTVEQAVREAVPEITAVEVVPNDPGPAILTAVARDPSRNGWITGPPVEEVPEGRPVRLHSPGRSAFVVRVGDKFSVFHNACPHQNLPIDGGTVDPETGTLTCPWHGFEFDALSGECRTAPACQLEPFPMRVEEGHVCFLPQ